MRNELSPAKSLKPILGFPSLDEMDMESIMDKSNAATDELKYGTTGDGFKPLAEVMLPDVRQQFWARLQSDGTFRNVQLEDLHKRMSELTLNSTVAEEVRTGFDTARNLFLYSWFVNRFLTVAELQAYAALEFALGKRIAIEKAGHVRGLSRRFDLAVQKGWIRAEGVRRYRQVATHRKEYAKEQEQLFKEFLKAEDDWRNLDTRTEAEHASDYLRNLKDGIPRLRNSMAHGEPMLHGGAALTLEICCDLINQLFPEKT